MIVAGGMDFNHSSLKSVEILILSPKTEPRWIQLGEMVAARAWFPIVAVLNNRLMVAGGKVKSINAKITQRLRKQKHFTTYNYKI